MVEKNKGQRAYWNECLRAHWDAAGASSVAFGKQFNLWRYRVRGPLFRRLVRRLGLKLRESSVLDVGSGTGFYLEQWRALGVRSLAGLDFSDWAVEQLQRTYPTAKFYRADIGAVPSPLPPEAFDAVSALDVLVHLVDDTAYLSALANLYRALKPGGYLLYSDSFFHGGEKQHENYWKGRSLASVSAAMQECGFEIDCRVPMSVLMSAPTDTRHRERNELVWNMAVKSPVQLGEWIGFLMGALLYPLEVMLVSNLKESPGIEIMVCRKAV
jgi:SAM-dependent methyltransferase